MRRSESVAQMLEFPEASSTPERCYGYDALHVGEREGKGKKFIGSGMLKTISEELISQKSINAQQGKKIALLTRALNEKIAKLRNALDEKETFEEESTRSKEEIHLLKRKNDSLQEALGLIVNLVTGSGNGMVDRHVPDEQQPTSSRLILSALARLARHSDVLSPTRSEELEKEPSHSLMERSRATSMHSRDRGVDNANRGRQRRVGFKISSPHRDEKKIRTGHGLKEEVRKTGTRIESVGKYQKERDGVREVEVKIESGDAWIGVDERKEKEDEVGGDRLEEGEKEDAMISRHPRRSRKTKVDYAEPSLGKKLRKGDPHTFHI
jgi:hypothetical protein